MESSENRIIIGNKEYRDYFKIVMNIIDHQKKITLTARGKENIGRMLKLACFLNSEKEIKFGKCVPFSSKFIPENSDKEIIVPELSIELFK
jgi:hypothetical protein